MYTTIHEDNDILIIDKQPGVRVDHDPDNNPSLEDSFEFPVERHGIVHRIDKDTSGLLAVAKTTPAYDNLKSQFQNHTVKKVYQALVAGKTESRGEVRSYIARDPKRKQAMKVIDYPTGQERGKLREAITFYKTIARYTYSNQPVSLIEVEIETGRTHQIRVHMQSTGHPLIGDEMYNSKTSKELSQKLGLARQFLHAVHLEINHPTGQERLAFNSLLPNDLQIILTKLEKYE